MTPSAAAPPTDTKHPWRGHWLLIVTYCCLALFFWLPHSYVRMVAWPWLLIWQSGFLTMAILAVWMLRQNNTPFQTLGYGLDWILGLWAIAMLVSIVVAPVSQLAIWYAVMASAYGGLLYVLNNWIRAKPNHLYHLWLGIVTTGLGTNLVSLVLWRPSLDMWQTDDFFEAVRNALPLGHHNFMGGLEVLMLPLAITFALAWTSWRRWLGIAASLLALVVLYGSGSRGALLGIVVIVFAAALVLIRQVQGRHRLTVISLSGLALIGITALTLTNPRMRQLLGFFFRPGAGQTNPLAILLRDGPILDRWQMLQAAGNIFRHQPVTGVGLGNMVRVFNLYRPLTLGTQIEHAHQLHNTPAQLLGELGLLGIFALGVGAFCLGWLWFRLSRQPLDNADRWLLTGAGLSLVAYGVSSLTDYQLENIPIASLTGFNVLALISLASRYQLSSPLGLNLLPKLIAPKVRRIISLLVLFWIGVALWLWIPVNASAYLQSRAAHALTQENFAQADTQLDRASKVTPWDPIPSALAAHNLYQLSQGVGPEDEKILRKQAVDYYQRAVAAAPNDAWFHYNLANLLLSLDPPQAEIHAGKTVQLLPRENYNTYFVLGLAYLLQNKIPQAVDAFALETLANPQVMSMSAWEVPPLNALKENVTATSVDLYDQLPSQGRVYEQGLLVRWWQGVSLGNYKAEELRPIVQALFLAEQNPQAALAILNDEVASDRADTGELLLRAWLNPSDYLADYLQAADLSPAEVTAVSQTIQQNRSLRDWLQTDMVEPPRQGRGSLGYAYRNRYAGGAEELFLPEGIRISSVTVQLNLFPDMPRVYPPLDRLMNQYRTETLGLPAPTTTGFRLVNTTSTEP
jgi:putative inorganic carbon (HCO3(-)) transporter